MCGIVGYIGKRQVFPILIKGLKRLEYRGYDSAGVAMINDNGDLSVYKTKGKVADLEQFCEDKNITGTVGIAHTRWATHGEPSSVNAHPHYSESKNIAIIHNGIIENYADLKKKLVADGVKFRSDTDTEVIVQLIEYIQTRKNVDLLTAVRFALTQLIGAYAIAVLDKRDKDQIIAARKQSPLVIGIGEDEFFLGSDATPIIEYTDKVVYLDDDNIAVIRRGDDLKVVNTLNDTLNPEVCTVDLDLGQIEKGGFPHFMLKEIFEQPECLENCMRGRINVEANNVTLSAVIDYRRQLLAAKRVIIVACGTSWHAGLIGKQLIESLCRIPVEVEYASEFRYRNPVIDSSDVVIAISQSGETTGQVTVLLMLALALGKEKGTITNEQYSKIVSELCTVPEKMKSLLKLNDRISELSKTFTYASNFLYLGRGYNYPVALEGALKLKEISYIHAEGYPAAEMKHGPIALIDSDMPVVVIAPHDEMYQKVLSNIQEIKARKGKVIALVSKGDDTISKIADEVIEIPQTLECLEPLVASIPLQLLAYHIAVCKGKNVDQPRNLAKSVTVE